jgi:dienelactone hydrolase
MRGRILGALLSIAVVAAFAGWIASQPGLPFLAAAPDPGQPGPYAVDRTSQSFARTLPNGQTRTIETQIWYPVAKDAPATPAQLAPRTATIGGPFPLLVFSHGYQGSPQNYSLLFRHLVSHGFVVAAPDHRDCKSQCGAAEYAQEVAVRPADVSMVLDGMLALDEGDDPLYRHLVDPKRVAVAGHSFGGWTTLVVLQQDPRFVAGLAMAPATWNTPSPDAHQVSKPLLLMAGVVDSMVPYALTAHFFADVPASAPDHYLLAVQSAGHQFFDRCGPNGVTTSCAASMPQPQLQALENRVGTAFLLKYVAGLRVTDEQLGLHDDSPEYAVVKGSAETVAVAPTARPVMASSSTPEVPAGTVLFKDDLTSAQSGQLATSSSDPTRFDAEYTASGYEIAVKQALGQGEVIVPGTFSDVTVAVDVELLDPAPSQYVFVACRAKDAAAQYRLSFRPANGQLSINRWLPVPGAGSPWRQMIPAGFSTEALQQGSAANHAELSCRGTSIAAQINGTTVASASDNSYAAGQIWLGVGESAGFRITGTRPAARFRNLVITAQ